MEKIIVPKVQCPYCGETNDLDFENIETEFDIDGNLSQTWVVKCLKCKEIFYRCEQSIIIHGENIKKEDW